MPRPLSFWLCWTLLSLGLAFICRAQEVPSAPRARGIVKVAKVVGDVSVIDTATTLTTKIAPNTLVVDGQVVETGANSSVVLVFSNGAVINLRANSRLEVTEFLQNPFAQAFSVRDAFNEPSSSSTKLILRKGEMISQVKKLNREAGSSFTVETPVGAAGIRGTAFRLGFIPSNTNARFILAMAEGLIRFVPTRGRAVDLPGGRQLVFDAEIDREGRVLSVPDLPEPTNVPASEQAVLQQTLTEAIGAAISIEFAAAAPGVAAPFSSPSATTVPTANAATNGGDVTGRTLASPPPTPPAQRTTPGDGE